MVNPFTEVGMIAQVTAIQSVTDDRLQRRGVTGELPHHLRDLVDQTSGDLDGDQRLRMDCCLHRVELHYNYIGEIQPYQVAFLQWAIHPYRHIQRLFCTAPSGLLVAVHCHLAACWRD